MNLPFHQKRRGNVLIREFSEDVNSGELVWHRDRVDRHVEVRSGDGWKLQLENNLPVEMIKGKVYHIPRHVYHRVLKGRQTLVVEITEKTNQNEALIRQIIREALLLEVIEFRELDSPLVYNRARNVKRLALCDTSVEDRHLRPDGKLQSDAYFNEYQEWERYGVSGRRLKKPRPGPMIPGVSDACIIGFLDFHKYGDNGWYIDYMKTRGDKGGQGTASKLVDEFFKRYAEPGILIHFGKMMSPAIGHLKDKMVKQYPDTQVIGAVNY